MGTIIYKPHCARCGAIITQEVICRKMVARVKKDYLYHDSFNSIEPYRCVYCGEVFETIEIPMPKEEVEDGNNN